MKHLAKVIKIEMNNIVAIRTANKLDYVCLEPQLVLVSGGRVHVLPHRGGGLCSNATLCTYEIKFQSDISLQMELFIIKVEGPPSSNLNMQHMNYVVK